MPVRASSGPVTGRLRGTSSQGLAYRSTTRTTPRRAVPTVTWIVSSKEPRGCLRLTRARAVPMTRWVAPPVTANAAMPQRAAATRSKSRRSQPATARLRLTTSASLSVHAARIATSRRGVAGLATRVLSESNRDGFERGPCASPFPDAAPRRYQHGAPESACRRGRREGTVCAVRLHLAEPVSEEQSRCGPEDVPAHSAATLGHGVRRGEPVHHPRWDRHVLTPNRYQSNVQFFVSTSQAADTADLAQGSTFTQKRVKSYTQIVKTPIVLGPVIEESGVDLTPAELQPNVDATSPSGHRAAQGLGARPAAGIGRADSREALSTRVPAHRRAAGERQP